MVGLRPTLRLVTFHSRDEGNQNNGDTTRIQVGCEKEKGRTCNGQNRPIAVAHRDEYNYSCGLAVFRTPHAPREVRGTVAILTFTARPDQHWPHAEREEYRNAFTRFLLMVRSSIRLKCVLFLVAAMSAALSASGQSALPEAGPSSGSMFGPTKKVVALTAQFTTSTADKPGQLSITATILPGWHIYSTTQPSGGPVATKITPNLPQGVGITGEFRPITPPTVKKDTAAYGDLPIEFHEGRVTWVAPIEIAAGVDIAKLEIPGKVMVQPCDAKSCLPPHDVGFVAKLGAAAASPGVTAASPDETANAKSSAAVIQTSPTLLTELALAFLGGLILNLMPCVLPVISLKILAFLEQAGESRGRVFFLNVWYSLGLLSVFMVLAALAATAGLAWGEQFTLPWFKVAMTAFVFVMALSFLGVWEIPIPGFVGTGQANQLQAKEGPSGAFFKGVFTTILATPCSGPFLGPVFGYLLKQPPYTAYLVFGAVGLGMASPYLVIGALPELIRFLPKPGAWMETVKQFMGFLLLATVVYLFNTLSHPYFIPTLSLLVGIWFACWWIGRTPLTAAPQWRFAAWCGGLLVATLVGWFAFTVLMQQSKIAWQPFSPDALERAQSEGKTVLVDFTANWCPNCKLNSKTAIETEAVRRLIEANGVVPLLADWTDRSPVIKKALNEFGYNSIPLLVVWPSPASNRKVPIALPDLLRESDVLDALKTAGPSKSLHH
jgi:thiol:disulfide interchange protein